MSSSRRSTGDTALVTRQSTADDTAASELAVDDDTTTSDATVEDPDGGFEFGSEPKHHDPVVRIADAFERDEISATVLENADTDALKTFVVRAEAGEFDVRSEPALEAAVRIARRLIYEEHRE
ncbi:hypothetical protein EGH24_11065 [Halonotius terrestris]|uniref:Uncharacterized protein n=1 Tax=Halonotius terrestris TaxID=2487750 RepID=A0A8J8PBG9_9EURY|nr:hypothetical protein [Halonotius terrestris]TQQ80006.1 hypothetical protein EGH24_11065 [Halonotius terrestris]